MWLNIIMMIIQFVLSNLTKASSAYSTAEVSKIAKAINKAEPRFNVGCLENVLPGFLRDLADVLSADGFGKLNYIKLIEVTAKHLFALIKCQFGSAQSLSTEEVESALPGQLIQCGLGAFIEYSMTKDLNKAITSFITCFMSKVGGGGIGGGGGTPNPGGFKLDPVSRCG